MSLLTLIQSAADQINLPRPASVIGNDDPTVLRLRRFANQSGQDFVQRHEWRKLVREQTFTTTAADAQAGALPDDFGRFINDTLWNRTTLRQLVGPISAQEWAAEKGDGASSTYHDYFRLRGTDFLITPQPAAGETIAFEYVSAWWVDTDGDGVGEAAAFAADANTTLIPEELLVADVVWRFKADVGLDYAEDMSTAERMFDRYAGQEKGARSLSIGRTRWRPFRDNVPETGFGP